MHPALENLWYGDVRPQVRVNTPEMKKALEQVEKIRTCLCETLTDEQKEQLLLYDDAVSEVHAIAEDVMFSRGFRFGADVIQESLGEQQKEK